MRTIEFACSHNHGRSPLAEAFARKYVSDMGIKELYFISSGTHVHEINEQLAGRKPFPHDEREWLKSKYLKRFGDNRHPDPVTILSKFVDEEREYRSKAFSWFGLGAPKEIHDQMMPRSDVDLVLVMGKKNLVRAREIYGKRPEIETLAGYANGNPEEEFFTAFGGRYKDYMKMARIIGNLVDKSISKYTR